MECEGELIIISHRKTMSWITKEINISIKNLESMSRYQKAREEGYLSALKKIQAKLDER